MKKKKYELDTLAFTSSEYVSKWGKIWDVSDEVARCGILATIIGVTISALAGLKLRKVIEWDGYQVTAPKQKEALAKMKEECDKNVIEND